MGNHAALIRQENAGLDVVRRGRNFVEFALPDGKKRHVATIDPLHIRNQPDVEIDTAWEDGDGQPYFKKMVKSDYNVYAGLNSSVTFNAGQIIEYRQPDTNAWVKVQPQDLVWENEWGSTQYISAPQGVAAQINDDILYWPGAYGAGRNFQWQAQTKRLRKDLILDSLAQLGAPPAWMTQELVQLRLQFLFEKSANVQIWYKSGEAEYQLWDEATPVQTNVRIEFRQGDTRLWWFEPAHAYAADNADPFLLTTRLIRSGDVLFVEIVIPWTWLQAAAYPVVVDPTFTDGYGGDATTYKDTHIKENAATTNYGTNINIEVSDYGAGDTSNVLIEFDVSSIGGTIDSATLSIYNPQLVGSFTMAIYRLLVSWTEAGATWNSRNGTNNWSTAGAQGSGTDHAESATQSGVAASASSSWTNFTVTDDVQAFVDGTTNYGWVIDPDSAPSSDYALYWSSDYVDNTALRPKLVVEYTEAYTLTADAAGSYALTGKDPTLAAARKAAESRTHTVAAEGRVYTAA